MVCTTSRCAEPSSRVSDVLAVVARCLLYLGTTLAIGQLAAEWARGAHVGAHVGASTTSRASFSALVWCAVLGAIVLLFVAQFLALELTPTRDDVAMLVRQTAWGRGWALLAASGVVFALTSLFAAPWAMRVAIAIAMAGSMSGLGHAAADDLPVLSRTLDSVHVLGVGAWIGALMLLHAETEPWVWRRFSALATIASASVVFSGVGAAWRRLGMFSLSAIATSDYGQLLALKLALVAVVLLFGYAHRRSVGAQRSPSRRTVQLELVFAAIVFVTTAWLTGTSPPE